MTRRTPTGFDRYFEQEMKDPEFAAEYKSARKEIDSIDEVIRALDAAREEAGLSKAALARLANMKPEVVRRLFTAEGANPTLDTIVKLAGALNLTLGLHPREGRRVMRKTAAARNVRS